MIESTVEGLLDAVRFIGRFLIEDIFLDVLIRPMGYWIRRLFNKKAAIDETRSLIVGILFWVCIVYLAAVFSSLFSQSVAQDECLDAGGQFDEATHTCLPDSQGEGDQ